MSAKICINITINNSETRSNSNVKQYSDIVAKRIKPRISNTALKTVTDETELFRYMDYYKFKNLLETQCLFFSNTKINLDNRERQISTAFYKSINQDSKDLQQRIEQIKQEKIKAYLTCWSKEQDSYALWKLYNQSNDGCRISTTFGELKKCLGEDKVAFFEVEYITPNAKDVSLDPIFFEDGEAPTTIKGAEKYKIYPYKYEQEVRGVIYSEVDCNGILFNIDVNSLIKKVMPNPFATEESRGRITDLVAMYIPNVQYESSEINESKKKG